MNSFSPFKNVYKKADLEFDYETNHIRIEDSKEGMETKLHIYNKLTKSDS